MKKMRLLSCLIFFTIACQSHKVVSFVPCDFIDGLQTTQDLQCGKIEVPENHDNPTGKIIQLAYVIVRAKDTNSKAYPMIYLAGGPGSSSLSGQKIKGWLESPLRANRDLIIFDQRGIGYSMELPNINEELYNIFAANVSEVDEQAVLKKLIIENKQICDNRNIQLQYYNTFQIAKDVGVLMKHLAYSKYNLYGVSYGTRLANVIQQMYPQLLNAVVCNSPNLLIGDFLIDRMKNFSLALERVLAFCENDEDCSTAYPDLKEQYIEAINSLKQSPLEIDIDGKTFYVNAQDGVYFLRRKLYANNSRAEIPPLIMELKKGGGPILKSLIEHEFGPEYNYLMWLAVERYEGYNQDNTAEVINEIRESFPLLPVAPGLFTASYLAVENLHHSTLSNEDKIFEISSIPTLIMVNQYDPVTPPENGHVLMKDLINGQLFILDEGGHGGGNMECRYKVMNAFMDAPFSNLDTSCLNIYKQ